MKYGFTTVCFQISGKQDEHFEENIKKW